MDTERTGADEPVTTDRPPVADGDRVVGDTTTYVRRPLATTGYTAPIVTGENVMPVRDRVQWGPVLAGLLSAIATMLLMTVLGIALGASVLDRTASGEEIGTWAAFWGGISAIVSFFVGGWIAARTAAVGGEFAGLINGFTVGAAGLVLLLWLTGTGLGNLFGTIGANIGDIANLAQDQAQSQGVTTEDVQAQAQEAQQEAEAAVAEAEQTARSSFDEIRNGAWGTLGGLVLALGAATLGGYLGHNRREELVHGTG
jgi:hypothetical protein